VQITAKTGDKVATNFKSDDSFLRKLAVGAAGTNATIERLKALGFNPIELERGSTGFKIWKKIKIKRVRVPDILCLKTGLRFESRGKTKPEVSMSHSLKDPRRAWDAGMRDDDYVSIVVFEQSAESPLDLKRMSPVHFISVKDLRDAFAGKRVSITKPKGVEEGSEIRVVWTSAIANQRSTVSEVSATRLRLTPAAAGKAQTVQLSRSKGAIVLAPQVQMNDTVEANQIVAAAVPVTLAPTCPPAVDEAYFVAKLASINLSERYAAAKALRYRRYTAARPALEDRMNHAEEDIYVQLEAAAALAAHNHAAGWIFIETKLRSSVLDVPLETQLETLIVASEIQQPRSECLLIEVLRDTRRDEELRAGAAWALGQFATASAATALVDTFNSTALEVKSEAARALLRITGPQVAHVVELLKTCDPSRRDGISWALARTGGFDPRAILLNADDNLRGWVSYIVGHGKDRLAEADVDAICGADPEVYFAASVLWQILASWVDSLTEF
jgi:HEAT repeat protein